MPRIDRDGNASFLDSKTGRVPVVNSLTVLGIRNLALWKLTSPKRIFDTANCLCLLFLLGFGWLERSFSFVVVVDDDDGIKRILRHLYSILDDRAKQLLTTTSSKFPILFHLTITTGALGRF